MEALLRHFSPVVGEVSSHNGWRIVSSEWASRVWRSASGIDKIAPNPKLRGYLIG
jgi:hypothetical protein